MFKLLLNMDHTKKDLAISNNSFEAIYAMFKTVFISKK